MKKMLLELLGEHQNNCGDNRGRNGEYLGDDVEKIIDLVEKLPDDAEVERLKKDAEELSWTKFPDRMGQ